MKAQRGSTSIALLINMVGFMRTFIVHCVHCDILYIDKCIVRMYN